MVIKEIRKFVIQQMLNSDWVKEYSSLFISSKLSIKFDDDGKKFIIIDRSFNVSIKELGINRLYFWWLMKYVKRSCNQSNKRKRDEQIKRDWDKFLERNKDIKRDSTINKILD